MTDPPKRKVTIEISTGGDTREDAIYILREMLKLVEQGGNSSITGGYSNCGTLTVIERPDVTHHSFFAELEEHLAEKEKEPQPV